MEKLFKYPALVVGIITVITVFLGIQLPRAELDNNNIRFLPEKNQAKIISEYIDDTFGGHVMLLVGLERPYRTVFEKGFLAKIQEFAQAVENVELVKSVNSIMSTQYITGDGDTIVVSDLVPEDFAGTDDEITELQRRIASWDLFRGSLVSDDASATQVIITLDVLTVDITRPEVAQSVKEIRNLTREIFPGEAEVYFTGQTVVSATINESIVADNILLIPLVVIVVLALLFFSFRRFSFVVLPLLTVIIAAVWTIGTAALFGIKLSILTTLLPVILIAVGSAYGIHIVTHYMEDTRNKTLTVIEHRVLVLELMRKLIKPIFLAALTTLAGFVSFCFTPIVPMREFGLCASVGVFAAFTVAALFIPAMFLLRGPRTLKGKQKEQNDKFSVHKTDRFSNVIAGVFTGIAGKKILVLSLAVLAVGISIYGLSKVIIDNVLVEYFQNETDISRSDRFIREHFGGSKDLTLVVIADTTEELLHPDVLQAVDGLSAYLTGQVPAVGKVVGFTDIVKRINQVFNVDQSPEGLQPVISHNVTDSFGFDDSGYFGFGGFGSDDDFLDSVNPTASQQVNLHDITQYSAADLLLFLDNAAGKSSYLSGNDLVRELKRLTNYEGMAYYEIPTNPKRYGKETPEELQLLVANYLVLLAGSDDFGYSNDPLEPTVLKTTIQLRTTGSRDSRAVINTINEYITVNFPQNVQVVIGGGITYEMAVTDLILNSQIISIFISVLMVFLIVAISNKSFIAGIIGAVPLTLAILCNFAVMGLLGIKLSLGTAMIASLAVGIGIDYTIHFIEFFKREYQFGSPDFLRRTFIGCGKAIIINALSVGLGFGVLAFSQFKFIAELGLLIALSMILTAFVSLTVIPVLLTVIKPKFIYGK